MSFGERLEEFRQDNRNRFKTKKMLAEALNIKYEQLYTYLENKSKPSAEILEKISGLGCDVNYLLTGVRGSFVKEPNVVYATKDELEELRSEMKRFKSHNDLLLKELEEKNIYIEELEEKLKVALHQDATLIKTIAEDRDSNSKRKGDINSNYLIIK